MPSKHPQDGVENGLQLLADVLSQKAQHEVAVLLQQLVLPPIAAIRDRIGQVLSAIEFDGQVRIRAQQVDFKCAEAVERNRLGHIDTEASARLPQRIQSPVES